VDSVLRILIALGLAYLVGGIPFGLMVGKVFFGVDVRKHGSGNVGATNVFRTLGAKPGAAVLLLDAFKGAAAVLVASLLHPEHLGPTASDWVLIGAMFTALLGHSYSPYLGLRGGKGVATAAGALLVLTPYAWPILVVTFAVVVLLSRIVSLGSVVIAVEFPLLMLLLYPERPAFITLSILASALVIWRHKDNIVRILRGEEAKIVLKCCRPAGEEEDGK